MTKIFHLSYNHIISVENLLGAWREFVRGKRHRRDVQEVESQLMGNILTLYRDLTTKRYEHGPYEFFQINDPKPRDIHKATVRDRLVHHAIYRVLYWFYDQVFIPDSFSCRLGKGTHKAINRLRALAYQVSQNHTKTCWVLKCDIRRFFASINHGILLAILRERIPDERIIRLLQQIIASFYSTRPGVGLPLGNLTSQLLVNIYLNEFDRFVKHGLKAKYYLRYADDFVLLSDNRRWLETQLPSIQNFLSAKLKLTLHPTKVSIRTLASGLDFLGWVHFTDHRVLRRATRRRMERRLSDVNFSLTAVIPYRGLLRHGNTYRIQNRLGFGVNNLC